MLCVFACVFYIFVYRVSFFFSHNFAFFLIFVSHHVIISYFFVFFFLFTFYQRCLWRCHPSGALTRFTHARHNTWVASSYLCILLIFFSFFFVCFVGFLPLKYIYDSCLIWQIINYSSWSNVIRNPEFLNMCSRDTCHHVIHWTERIKKTLQRFDSIALKLIRLCRTDIDTDMKAPVMFLTGRAQ